MMIKNNIFSLMWMFCSVLLKAQVGINTPNPQATLHVSGTIVSTNNTIDANVKKISPTIRIEGLNNTNLGIVNDPVKAISVNENGDLLYSGIKKFTSETLILTNSAAVTTGNIVTGIITTKSITVDQPSMVRIYGGISSKVYQTNLTSPLSNKSAVLFGTYLTVSDNVSKKFGEDIKGYINGLDTGTIGGFTYPIYLNNSAAIYLKKGSYTINVNYILKADAPGFGVRFGDDYKNLDVLITPL